MRVARAWGTAYGKQLKPKVEALIAAALVQLVVLINGFARARDGVPQTVHSGTAL